MAFLVFKGTATPASADTEPTQQIRHSFVCMTSTTDQTVAIERATSALLSANYLISTLDHDLFEIPSWRLLLPTPQGKSMRAALRYGIELTVVADSNK
jgi:hypothetical protein